MKSLDMFLRGVTSLFTCKTRPDNAARAKINREFRHFERGAHIAHSADDQARSDPKIFSSSFQSLQHRGNNLLMRQSLLGVKDRNKARLEIDNSIPA
jgi:hypothetical protein